MSCTKNIVTLILIFYFFSTQAQQLDSLGVICIINSYEQKGIAIKTVLTNYEHYLIKHGFLSHNEQNRYSDYFNLMIKENEFIGNVPQEILTKVKKVEIGQHIDRDCFKNLQKIPRDSGSTFFKFYQLKGKLNKFSEKTWPKELASYFLVNFSKEEMKSSFFRMNVLIIICWVSELNQLPQINLQLPMIKG